MKLPTVNRPERSKSWESLRLEAQEVQIESGLSRASLLMPENGPKFSKKKLAYMSDASIFDIVEPCIHRLALSGYFSKNSIFSVDEYMKITVQNLFDAPELQGEKQADIFKRLQQVSDFFRAASENQQAQIEVAKNPYAIFRSILNSLGDEDVFTPDWYSAKIMYELARANPNFFLVGMLWEQLHQKQTNEQEFIIGRKNSSSRAKAELAKPVRAAERKSAMLECIARLWHESKSELDPHYMRMDSNAAQAIYAKAEKERPPELIIKKSGKVKGPDAIRRRLPELRASGKID